MRGVVIGLALTTAASDTEETENRIVFGARTRRPGDACSSDHASARASPLLIPAAARVRSTFLRPYRK
jgi:hypothetical protein